MPLKRHLFSISGYFHTKDIAKTPVRYISAMALQYFFQSISFKKISYIDLFYYII